MRRQRATIGELIIFITVIVMVLLGSWKGWFDLDDMDRTRQIVQLKTDDQVPIEAISKKADEKTEVIIPKDSAMNTSSASMSDKSNERTNLIEPKERLNRNSFKVSGLRIGFGCVNIVHDKVNDSQQRSWLKVLEQEISNWLRGSGPRTASALSISPNRVKFLSIRYNGHTLSPHKSNYEAIDDFYNKFKEGSTKFLRQVAEENNVDLIVFAEIPEFSIQNFVNKKSELLIIIQTFFLDSQTLSAQYVSLTEDQLKRFRYVKAVISEAAEKSYLEALNYHLSNVSRNTSVEW